MCCYFSLLRAPRGAPAPPHLGGVPAPGTQFCSGSQGFPSQGGKNRLPMDAPVTWCQGPDPVRGSRVGSACSVSPQIQLPRVFKVGALSGSVQALYKWVTEPTSTTLIPSPSFPAPYPQDCKVVWSTAERRSGLQHVHVFTYALKLLYSSGFVFSGSALLTSFILRCSSLGLLSSSGLLWPGLRGCWASRWPPALPGFPTAHSMACLSSRG